MITSISHYKEMPLKEALELLTLSYATGVDEHQSNESQDHLNSCVEDMLEVIREKVNILQPALSVLAERDGEVSRVYKISHVDDLGSMWMNESNLDRVIHTDEHCLEGACRVRDYTDQIMGSLGKFIAVIQDAPSETIPIDDALDDGVLKSAIPDDCPSSADGDPNQ